MKSIYSRRRFIQKTGQSGLALSAGMMFPGLLNRAEAGTSVQQETTLAVVKGKIPEAIHKIFETLGGIEKYIKPNDMVLIKPNASFANPPEISNNTNPEVVKGVAQKAIEAGASRVIILDHTMGSSEPCFKRNNYASTFEGMEKVKLIGLDAESHYQEVDVPNGKALTKIKVAKLLSRPHVLINMPCAKSHAATQVSFGLKNLMGLIWDRSYFHQGTDLDTAIAELATVIQPHITILDATRALLTGGPNGPGKIQELQTLVASTDRLAVDAYATTMANWNNRTYNPDLITHIKHANKLGVGEIDLKKIDIHQFEA